MGDILKVNPWERQPGESGKAFEAFACYRDMGESRTFTAVAEKLQKSCTLIRRWKAKFNWEERVSAYDIDLTRKSHKEKQRLVSDTQKRQLKIAAQLELKALEALKLLEPEEMSPRDIKELLKLATDIEHKILIGDSRTVEPVAEDEERSEVLIYVPDNGMRQEDNE